MTSQSDFVSLTDTKPFVVLKSIKLFLKQIVYSCLSGEFCPVIFVLVKQKDRQKIKIKKFMFANIL